ncbi:hypothetical protein OUZ56_019427 [Daphnia magna]|uniref:Peptidase S1 domain-containing protein n=1 Tax=Daphnia magna TaxID=35525 RepID=A0ABQ9ZBJ6_9CRUS|nr:hypothetical protein OUZ56_019427 [Daphnia magna]
MDVNEVVHTNATKVSGVVLPSSSYNWGRESIVVVFVKPPPSGIMWQYEEKSSKLIILWIIATVCSSQHANHRVFRFGWRSVWWDFNILTAAHCVIERKQIYRFPKHAINIATIAGWRSTS